MRIPATAGRPLADGACSGIEINDDVAVEVAAVSVNAFVFCADRNDDEMSLTGGMTI